MGKILFFDTEVALKSKQIHDIAAVSENEEIFHSSSKMGFAMLAEGSDFLCGHNIINHDLKYIKQYLDYTEKDFSFIDTLYLSALFFPVKPYHKLLKDEKLQTGSFNDPVKDSLKAKDLFYDEVTAFYELDDHMKQIFLLLLKESDEFKGFFEYIKDKLEDYIFPDDTDLEKLIKEHFSELICSNSDIGAMKKEHPIELAYCLALINAGDKQSSFPFWVAKNYPYVHEAMRLLRGMPCEEGCAYCKKHFSIHDALKEYFGYEEYRVYDGEPLQERAVQAAVNGKSLLAVFPTGGGKSLAFQIPALISGNTSNGLTVVISPLQSLMKDQVDNLEKAGINEAVTINGSLDPVSRREAIEAVESGVASILYIAPESLRSASVQKLLVQRNVVRFVIDEAHCFSAWGQDFRVDYLFIGQFIKDLQEEKKLDKPIPVSCFTATAKQKVISDIKEYFSLECGVELELFTTSAARKNLRYEVIWRNTETDEEKYQKVRELILAKRRPTIVYAARTRRTEMIADRLCGDGINAVAYHGQMETLQKQENQERFMSGEVDVVVATTAFGMGIDKDDVGLVIHYNIPTSLEDYTQEAGRAGRDPSLEAECYILFNDSDLGEHLNYMIQTKLSFSDIQQIWKAIKLLSGKRSKVTNTPLEIARKAGWSDEGSEIETKVKAAIMALEKAGYIKRKRNVPRVHADGISLHSMSEAVEKLGEPDCKIREEENELAKRILSFLFSRRSNAEAGTHEPESRVDYIADNLGLKTEKVMSMVLRLREEGFLNDHLDLTARIKESDKKSTFDTRLKNLSEVEKYLIENLEDGQVTSLKEINTKAQESGIKSSSVDSLKKILSFWVRQRYIERIVTDESKYFRIKRKKEQEELEALFEKRRDICEFILQYLFEDAEATDSKETKLFSVKSLQTGYNSRSSLLTGIVQATSGEIMRALMYLKGVELIEIDGGFLVLYNAMQLERLEMDNRIQYKKADYQDFENYYIQRIQQVHIVGEYARMMMSNYEEAMTFVSDYFSMEYRPFIEKYFKGREGEIKRSITSEKYEKLFAPLSPAQRRIIDDDKSQNIVVAAGPGSGKTTLLVHKLASLLMMEDIRSEQLLMLTFSRSAATEFKQRLIDLIGKAAYYVDIKTFHSYCFDLIGKLGTLEESDNVVQTAVDMIMNKEVDRARITKTALVIDEAQDMDADAFDLVEILMEENKDTLKVIAVGDDDQNIYEFRNSDSGYMRSLIEVHGASRYELLDNYRSDRLIVDIANEFAKTIEERMKTAPIMPVSDEAGTVVLTNYIGDLNGGLILPVIEQIRETYKGGSCCVMTKTNEEALLMTGILTKMGMKARLIQTIGGSNLNNLYEIRSFVEELGGKDEQPVISVERWDRAISVFTQRFKHSSCFNECLKLIEDYGAQSRKRYYSDFLEYIKESRLEDQVFSDENTILVSTIHKTKGREFDSVYMMLNDFYISSDEQRHALYVGMTRAKHALYVNYNNGLLDGCAVKGVESLVDTNRYEEPDEAVLQLDHKGVKLGYFKYIERRLKRLHSGSELYWDEGNLLASKGKQESRVAMISRTSMEQIELLRSRGFEVYRAEIRQMVYWKGKEDEEESLILLPNIYLRKKKRL